MPKALADSMCMRQNLSSLGPEGASAASNDQNSGVRATEMRPGCLDSTELLRGQKTVEINHNGLTYRLQATRLGKLILTK
ncbi:MAG: hypothetical protein JWP96_2249 [Polaromonas sp.]|nr:hypothetical protein [Polaromonas sp.]